MERPAIGAIVVEQADTGSGFAISDRHVLTAFHCVRDRKTKRPTQRPIFIRLLDGAELPAEVRDWDSHLDYALLELTEVLPADSQPLTMAAAKADVEGMAFRSKGFPHDRPLPRSPLSVHGSIDELDAQLKDGAPALQLFCKEVAAGRDPRGLSGAPVQTWMQWPGQTGMSSGWVAVGLVCWSQPRPGTGALGHGGTVFATPLAAIAASCPAVERLLVAARSPSPHEAGPTWPRGFPLDFSAKLEETKDFVGREELLARIQHFAEERDCGYFHIEASAGLGKSALAARFAELEQAPIFFADSGTGSVQPAECLRHLSAELILRHGLDPALIDTESGGEARAFGAILAEVSRRRGDAIWIVVDGLDEATKNSPGINPLLLPERLPPGVFMLLTSRRAATEICAEASTPRESLVLSAAGSAEQRDLRRYVEHRLSRDGRLAGALQAQKPSLDPVEFAAEIAAAAEANFMYVTYVLEDFAEGELSLNSRPKALDGYYEVRFWSHMEAERERDHSSWGEVKRPVLERLAVAAEPVSATWLASQTERPASEVEDMVLHPWRRFLRSERRGEEERWRVVHRSFSDFLGTKLDLPGAHRAIADALRSVDDPGEYGRHHLTEHLRAGGDLDALLALADDPEWERAQLAEEPTGRTLIHDFDQLWQATEAEGAGNISVVAWCALAIATVRTSMQAVPPPLLAALVEEGLWTLERARETVRQSPDPGHRALSLLSLARWDPALLDEALAAADEIQGWARTRIETKAKIAGAMAADRRRELLSELVGEIQAEDGHEGAHAARTLVDKMEDGELAALVDLAEETPSDIDRCILFLALAHRCGPTVATSERARTALHNEDLPVELLDVLAIDPRSDRAATAADGLLRSVGDDDFWLGYRRNSEWVLEALAPRLSPAVLLTIPELADGSGWSAFDFGPIALRLGRTGEADAALDLLNRNPSKHQGRTIAALAGELPAHLFDRALELAEQALTPHDRAEGLVALATRLPSNQRRELLAAAIPDGQLGDIEAKAAALVGFGPYLHPEHAAAAYPIVIDVPPSSDLARGLVALAPALPPELLRPALVLAESVADKLDDQARKALAPRLSGADLSHAATMAATDDELGPAAAAELVERLDAEERAKMVDMMEFGLLRPSPMAALALAPYLSAEQAARLRPKIGDERWPQMEILQSLAQCDGGDCASELAASAAAAQAPPDLVAAASALLVERGRVDDAIEFAERLDWDRVKLGALERIGRTCAHPSARAVRLARSIRDWDLQLQALVGLADDLEQKIVRDLCAELEQDAKRLTDQLSPVDRHPALVQRLASLLPLYARLPEEDRVGLRAELTASFAEFPWRWTWDILRVTNPSGEQMPPDIAELLSEALNRILYELSSQSRATALRLLAELAPVVVAIDGPPGAAEVGGQILAACTRWP